MELLDMLRDRQIRGIIPYLSGGGKIIPDVDIESGQAIYSAGNVILSPSTITGLIESGLIKDLRSSSLIACPVCGSIKHNVELSCPTHNATLQKEEIYEEPRTGFIGSIDKFITKDSKTLTSPVDKREIGKSDLVKRSYWFRCSAHGEVVTNPKIILHCLNGHDFDLMQANVVEIHRFEPSEDKLKFAVDYLKFLELIKGVMVENGYDEVDSMIAGASGLNYQMDAIYRKNDKVFALNVMAGGSSSLVKILSMLPQIYDIKQAAVVDMTIVFIPPISQDISSVLGKYGVKAISANSFDEVFSSLKQSILQLQQ
ncbi:MAG: hypothetical protein ACP5NC_06775 [Nitrososphaeria archaeon]